MCDNKSRADRSATRRLWVMACNWSNLKFREKPKKVLINQVRVLWRQLWSVQFTREKNNLRFLSFGRPYGGKG